MNIGLIGIGYWGPNLYRNLIEQKYFKVKYLCDISKDNLKRINIIDKKIIKTTNYKDLILDKSIDAVFIATPVNTHFKLAKDCLNANKHVFIEKPLSDDKKKCDILIELAKKKSLTLFVDHTFLYTPAVMEIKKISQQKSFGDLIYYDSTRINLGLIQDDINVLWDLAVHDISILNFLKNEKPTYVSCIGHKYISSKPETAAFLTLKYKTNFIAHINVNWLSPVKIRKTILGGSNKMIVYDDLEPSDKLKIYNKGIDVIKREKRSINLIKYKVGDTIIPNLKIKEALSQAISDFYATITNKNFVCKSDGVKGYEVVEILEAANKSMKLGGTPVKV
jgi:predicted dehydrogenase